MNYLKTYPKLTTNILTIVNRVDVAFICMCAFAIDELFSDDWSANISD